MGFEKLTAYLDGLGETLNIPARDFIVTVDGKCVYRHFAGCRDEAGKTPMNGNEAYWVYSMTKPLTIACALKLVEDGRLAFEDKVCKYIPAFERHPEMTVEHLMSMRGGLDYDLNTPAMQGIGKEEGTLDIVARIADRELHFAPGTDFMYSLCHDVLGGVIEVVSGMKFGDFMKKTIWEPLGMEHTSFAPTDWHRANICAQYQREAEPNVNRKIPDMDNVYTFNGVYQSGGAGLITTIEDYCKFVTGVVCGKILRPETVEAWRWRQNTGKARASYESMGRPYMNYALGVQVVVDTSHTPAPMGLFGWDGAAGAACMMDPDNRVAYVYTQHVKGCGPAYSDIHPMLRDLTYEALRADGCVK